MVVGAGAGLVSYRDPSGALRTVAARDVMPGSDLAMALALAAGMEDWAVAEAKRHGES